MVVPCRCIFILLFKSHMLIGSIVNNRFSTNLSAFSFISRIMYLCNMYQDIFRQFHLFCLGVYREDPSSFCTLIVTNMKITMMPWNLRLRTTARISVQWQWRRLHQDVNMNMVMIVKMKVTYEYANWRWPMMMKIKVNYIMTAMNMTMNMTMKITMR